MLKEFRQSVFIQLCFIASIIISITALYLFDQYSYQEKRLVTSKIASSYISKIRNDLNQALSSVYPIAALIRAQNGDVTGFTELATDLLPIYPGLDSLQLQPDGILKYVVPLKGNESLIGLNLLHNPEREKESFLAQDSGKLTLAGPFELIQGGTGAAARIAVYIDSDDGEEFWGFVNALIRFPDVLSSANLASLTDEGIAYQLSRLHPDTGEVQIISSSNHPTIENPESFNLSVPNGMWTFQAYPINGWRDYTDYVLALLLASLFTFLTMLSAYLYSRLKTNQ